MKTKLSKKATAKRAIMAKKKNTDWSHIDKISNIQSEILSNYKKPDGTVYPPESLKSKKGDDVFIKKWDRFTPKDKLAYVSQLQGRWSSLRNNLYPIKKEGYPQIIAIPKFESKKFRDSQLEKYKKLKIFKVKKVSKKSDSIDAYSVDLDYKKIEKLTF